MERIAGICYHHQRNVMHLRTTLYLQPEKREFVLKYLDKIRRILGAFMMT